MPVYEYECESCTKVHEVTQKFSDAPLTECLDPKCKGSLRKLFSLSSIAFKGTGFYTTDYKRSQQKTESAPSTTTEKPKPSAE